MACPVQKVLQVLQALPVKLERMDLRAQTANQESPVEMV